MPEKFGGLCDKINNNAKHWEDYILDNEGQDYFSAFPCGYGNDEKLKLFDKLLLLKIFKPEKLMFACQKYVEIELGKLYAESPVATMDGLFASSDNVTPVIFVLS